jgi:hypothetical protein
LPNTPATTNPFVTPLTTQQQIANLVAAMQQFQQLTPAQQAAQNALIQQQLNPYPYSMGQTPPGPSQPYINPATVVPWDSSAVGQLARQNGQTTLAAFNLPLVALQGITAFPAAPPPGFLNSPQSVSLVRRPPSADSSRTLLDPLPRDPGGRTIVPLSGADGPHTVIGTRTEPRQSPAPYIQGVTFDSNGNPIGRTDVTDHGRADHFSFHFHPWNEIIFVPGPHPIPDPSQMRLFPGR